MSLQLQYNISNEGEPSAALPYEIFIENEFSDLSNRYHPLPSDLIDESFSLKDVMYEDEFNNPVIFENTEFEAYQLQLSSQDNLLQTQSENPDLAPTVITDSFDPFIFSSFTDFTSQNPLNIDATPDVTLTQNSFIPTLIYETSELSPDVEITDWDSFLPSSSSNSSLSKKYFTSHDSISSNSEGEPLSKICKIIDPQPVLPQEKRSYGKRSEEERKARRKEQNKTASIRYRERKKKEIDDYSSEEQTLMMKNIELRNQFEEVSRESKYLKKLLRELFVKEGILRSTSAYNSFSH